MKGRYNTLYCTCVCLCGVCVCVYRRQKELPPALLSDDGVWVSLQGG